ncbi:MAG TPA: hypothetical protein VHM20_05590 [Gammaproteobacteria bacterium]|nr:hypothetical protein [Gammaproteobacteria bacterium]
MDDRIYEYENPEKHIAHHLFYYREREQLLDVLYRLNLGLIPNKTTGLCVFDQIFFNERVKNTDVLSSYHCKEKCENFKKSARATLDFYAKYFEKDYLDAYTKREKLRNMLADAVLEKLEVENTDRELVKATIMSDLRGPYYKTFFKGRYPKGRISHVAWENNRNRYCLELQDIQNEVLIQKIMTAVKKEFNLSPHSKACRLVT